MVRRDLETEVAGCRIQSVSVRGRRSVRRQKPSEFIRRLTGRTLGRPGRVGKYLLLPLDGDGVILVVHLRMSGQLRLAAATEPHLRHTHVVLELSDGRELRFVDPRTFGELFVAPAGAAPVPGVLAHLGPDALDPDWSSASLSTLVSGRRGRLKPLLMDQRRLAGLGNIYSDEALFSARLRFDRPAGSLSPAEVGRLHDAIRATLSAAIEHRGSSLSDAQYVDLFGRPGAYQFLHRVYGREGRPCPSCTHPVARLRVGGRSTFLCPGCQA